MSSKIVKVNYAYNRKGGVEGRSVVGCPGLDVERIAQTDPALALAISQSPNKQVQVYSLRAPFVSGAVNDKVTASAGGPTGFCSDFLVLSARATVRRNNAFAGSVWKGQADDYNTKNSGIDVSLEIQGACPNYQITNEPTDLALLFDIDVADGGTGFPYGMVLPRCGRLAGEFTNTRAFTLQDGPVEVIIALRGISLGCGLETIELPFAREELAKMGIGSRAIVGDAG
jgi:hypothetical protein